MFQKYKQAALYVSKVLEGECMYLKIGAAWEQKV